MSMGLPASLSGVGGDAVKSIWRGVSLAGPSLMSAWPVKKFQKTKKRGIWPGLKIVEVKSADIDLISKPFLTTSWWKI
jgi:hypothetical protein